MIHATHFIDKNCVGAKCKEKNKQQNSTDNFLIIVDSFE